MTMTDWSTKLSEGGEDPRVSSLSTWTWLLAGHLASLEVPRRDRDLAAPAAVEDPPWLAGGFTTLDLRRMADTC